jgi:hypothetical protein
LTTLTEGTLRRDQNCTHISGYRGFRDLEATGQARTDAVPEPLTREATGDLPAAQASLKPADAVISAPPIRALTDLCPTCLDTPSV